MHRWKEVGRCFRNNLRSCITFLHFEPFLDDPDVQMMPTNKSNMHEHYENVLACADDTLVISERAEDILRNQIGKFFHLNHNYVGPLKIYLVSSLIKVMLENMTKV